LIEAICLHYDLPFHKVNLQQFQKALEQENLISILIESKVEKVRFKIHDLIQIHPTALMIVKFGVASAIMKCPPAEELRSSTVLIRKLFQKFQNREKGE